jgi:hypothetical protein
MDPESKITNNFQILFRKSIRPVEWNQNGARMALRLDPRTNINSFLFAKYSSSQNYFYSKEINNIITGERTPVTIRLTDYNCFDDSEDLLKRFYQIEEYPIKIEMLTEYYKFHEDVPRFFVLSVAQTVYNFYDKKRRIKYIRITRMLKGPGNIDDIKIHDSEQNSSLDKGISNHPSLLNMLSSYLKNPVSTRKKSYMRSSLRLDSLSFKGESSVTIADLDKFLAEVFNCDQKTNIHSSRLNFSLAKKQETIHYFEKSVFVKKKNEMKCHQKRSEMHKDTLKLRFFNNDNMFLKNPNINHIMVKKLNKDGFLKALSRNVSLKQQTIIKDNTATISNKSCNKTNSQSRTAKEELSKKFKNLNINNLNININFSKDLSKSSKFVKTIDSRISRAKFGTAPVKEEIWNFKQYEDIKLPKRLSLADNAELIRMESPTYSLLHKFKKDLKEPNLKFIESIKREDKVNCKISRKSKTNNVLSDSKSRLPLRKNGSTDKTYDVPLQKLNSFNLKFQKSIKENIRTADLNNRVVSTSKKSVNSKSRRPRSRDFNLHEKDFPKENIKSLLINPKMNSLCGLMSTSLKSKKNHKSSRLESLGGNKKNIFLSHHNAEVKKKKSFDRSNIKMVHNSIRESIHPSKRALRTLEINKISNFYNLFDDPRTASVNKCATVSSSSKPRMSEGLNASRKYQTINYMNLFSKKNSFQESKVKSNIEKSLKGSFIRKDKQRKFSNAS